MKVNIILIFFILAGITLNGQTFRLGLLSGMNISKLGGPGKDSFNYIGYKLGGRIGVDLRRQLRVSVDILYSRKGNAVSQTPSISQIYKNVRLDYMDIPFMVTFMDWMDDPDEEEYYKLHFSIGVSYSRLVNYRARDNLDNDVTNAQNFNKDNCSILGGLVYYPKEHIGINLEYSHSLINLEKIKLLPAKKVRNWSLSIIYMFNNRRERK